MRESTRSTLEESSVNPVKVKEASQTKVTDPDALLTIDELCRKLKIKKSFLYAPERRKGPNAIPCFRIGKYLRYDMQTVREWIARQSEVCC